MAARKETIIMPADVFPPDQTASRFPASFEEDRQDEVDRDLNDVLTELGGSDDASINIYRVTNAKDSRGGAYIDTVHPSEFSLQWLRDVHGGGSYRVHIRSSKQIVKGGNRLVKIDDVARKDPVSGNTNGIRELAETMQQGFMQLGQLLVKSLEASRVPPIDANQAQQAVLQNMLLMKQVLAPASVVPPSDPMAMFLKGVEIAATLKGGDSVTEREPGSTDILMKAIETFGGPLAEIVTANKQPPMQQLPVPQLAHNPQIPQPQIQQPQPQGDPMFGLKQYASMLENIAREDRDPYTYASLVIDSAPRADVENILSQPDPVQWLCQYNPNLADPAIRPWLDEFIGMMREILTPPQESGSVESTPANFSAQNATISGQSVTFAINQPSNPDNGDA